MLINDWTYTGPYLNFGDLPNFPYIGGAQAVSGMLRRSEHFSSLTSGCV